MSQIIFVLGFFLIGLSLQASEVDSVDLSIIEHKFVELGVKEERHYITNKSQWETFWRRFSKDAEPKEIDFRKYDIILFLMGTKGSSGYSVKIESVEKKQKHIDSDNIIHVLLCHPNSEESQLGVVTSPFAVKIIPKKQGKVIWKTHEQETGKKSCK